MLRSVFWKTLRDQRVATPVWGIMFGLFGAMIILSFSAIDPQARADLLKFFESPLMSAFTGATPRLATVAGLLNLRMMAFLPFLVSIFGIVAGTGALAGEREKGSLEVVMGYPIARWRLAVEKGAAIVVCTILIGLLMIPLMWLAGASTDSGLSLASLTLACLNAVPPALALGGLAFLCAALPMRRRTAASLVAGFGLVSYLVNTLGAVSKDLAAWRKLSIFYYYSRSQPLVDGMSWPDVFILLAVAAALFGLTPLVFQRQDLAERTGGFLALRLPWSRRPMGKPRLLGSVMAKSLRDASGAIACWGCLLASYALLALAILPSLTTVMNLDAMLQQLGPVIKTLVGEMFSMTTPEGLLRTVFFSMLPVMLAIFSIIEALGIVAGEEDARTMDIMMAHPVSRSRLIVERFAALTIGTILLGVVIVLALAVGVSANAPSLSFANVILATVNAIFPTLTLAALTLAATCLLPNGGGAGMVVALITVTSYLINNLAPLWKALQPLQKLSVFYWYNNSQPLNGMMRWGDSGLLALATVALIALAIWAFNRRDLATG